MVEERMILFVCRHGAAKSVLAASIAAGGARTRGMSIRAAARGIEPQAAMSPALAALLPDEAARLADEAPTAVSADDVSRAWRVITFNLSPDELPVRPDALERWDDVPAVAEDPAGARAAIERHVAKLLDATG